jgi:hypothetical protein
MSDALTSDGLAFSSAAALARCVGVHRDQVRMWRLHDQAPSDLTLAAWRAWFIHTGRGPQADAIPASLAGSAAEGAPPAAGSQESIPLDDIEAGSEGVWKARGARAKALQAERELAETDGRLVERRLVAQAFGRFGALVVDALARSTPWDALAPTLDGLTPAQRQAMRAAFDRWSLEFRGRLVGLPRTALADVLPRET